MLFVVAVLLAQAVPGSNDNAAVAGAVVKDQTNAAVVTVTGNSLKVTGDELARCLAQKCAPARDITLSMTHAENQLIAGDLKGARKTLLQSRHRNKRHAATLPIPVSNLLGFDAEVASLSGLDDSGRIGMMDAVSALKMGLPSDDARIAAKRILVGDMFLREGRYTTAVRMYDAVAKEAERSNWTELRSIAMFRALVFYATAASIDPAYKGTARRRFAELRALDDDASRKARDASILLEAKLMMLRNKNSDVDAIMGNLQGVRTRIPMLVTMPSIDTGFTETTLDGNMADRPNQWVDFSFLINRDGSVTNLEKTDESVNAKGKWIERSEAALLGRRYLPLDLPAGSPGLRRRERFMLVSSLTSSVRSRIRTQSGPPRLHIIDITFDPPVDFDRDRSVLPAG